MSKFALLFLITFIAGLYAIAFKGAVFGFYLYELIYFLNPGSRWWISSLPRVSYSFFVVLLTMFFFFIRRKEHNKNTYQNLPELKWFVLIMLSYFFVCMFAAAPAVHNKFLFDFFKLFIIMYIAYRLLDSDKKLEWALYCFCVGAAYIGYEAMMTGRNAQGRVEGIGMVDAPDANGTAAAIAPVIPILLYYAWQGGVKAKLVLGFCGLLVVNGLVLINSRGAFLGVVAGFAYFMAVFMFSKYKLPKQRMMVVVILIGAVAVGLRMTDDAFWERMGTIQSTADSDSQESGGRRINFWMATFDLLEDHPFGVGVMGYQVLSTKYLHDDSYFTSVNGQRMRAVHSMWFQGLAEIGWLGFIFFIALLFSLYRHLRKAKKALISIGKFKNYYLIIALEASIGGFLVAGTFIDAFRAEVLYWLIIFCICASNNALRSVAEHKGDSDPAALKSAKPS